MSLIHRLNVKFSHEVSRAVPQCTTSWKWSAASDSFKSESTKFHIHNQQLKSQLPRSLNINFVVFLRALIFHSDFEIKSYTVSGLKLWIFNYMGVTVLELSFITLYTLFLTRNKIQFTKNTLTIETWNRMLYYRIFSKCKLLKKSIYATQNN